MITECARKIVLLVHYFPPINSSGGKRMEAMAKYFARSGRDVVVITTRKSESDGEFTEAAPPNVKVIELDVFGRTTKSVRSRVPNKTVALDEKTLKRRIKNFVMRWLGQVPDPRLPWAAALAYPRLSPEVKGALSSANIIVATCPPWPPLLAAVLAKKRYKKPIVLDYRDQLSMCHEMPGGRFAKALELRLDHFLCHRADALVTISEPMAQYYSTFKKPVAVVLNGYDPEPLALAKAVSPWRPRSDGKPLVLRYLGLVSEGRIPRGLLKALDSAIQQGSVAPEAVKFEYYGEARLMHRFLQQKHPLLVGMFLFHQRVSYARAMELAVSADHLLFCENGVPPLPGEDQSAKGILTTKLFEYLASGRPVLAHISPQTLAGSFIVRASCRHFVSESAADFGKLLQAPEFWNPSPVEEGPFVRTLSRASQADGYLQVLDAVAAGEPLSQRGHTNMVL